MREEDFEKHWKKFNEEYGKNFGRFYNGTERRKKIAMRFYLQGISDHYDKKIKEIK